MSLTKVTYSLVKGAPLNVEDYIPAGTDTTVTDCQPFIQAAIDAAVLASKDLVCQKQTFKMLSGITHNNAVNVDLGGSVLDYTAATGNAWTIVAGKQIRQITTPLKNVWIKGDATLSDGNYNTSLNGLVFNAPQQQVENVLVTGCNKAFEFISNAYVINLKGCAAWYNVISWNANQDGNTNMGAALSASDCLFAHNDRDIFNKLCESQFFNCAFDQIQEQFVEDNINSAGGVFNSQLLFDACRFEAGGDVTKSLFVNNGRMIFRDCQFFEPLVFSYFFTNAGNIEISGGFTRIESEFYNSLNTGTITIDGFKPIDTDGPGWRFSAKESGVFNGDIETGTIAGFAMTTGNAGDVTASTAITPHSGTYSLRATGSATPNVLQSYAIKVNGAAKYFLLTVYMQNRNAVTVNPTIKFFDVLGNELSSSAEILGANVTTWTLVKFSGEVPNSAAYARFYLDLNSSFGATNFVYMDDFYVNQW
jgi:hypothetical protein